MNSFLSSGRSNQLISVCFLISGTVFLTNVINHFGCKLKTVLHDTNKNCQTNDLGRVFESNKEEDIHFALRIVQVQKLIKICRELTEIFYQCDKIVRCERIHDCILKSFGFPCLAMLVLATLYSFR